MTLVGVGWLLLYGVGAVAALALVVAAVVGAAAEENRRQVRIDKLVDAQTYQADRRDIAEACRNVARGLLAGRHSPAVAKASAKILADIADYVEK